MVLICLIWLKRPTYAKASVDERIEIRMKRREMRIKKIENIIKRIETRIYII